MSYKPSRPFDTSLLVYPVTVTTAKGSTKKTLGEPFQIFASLASYGGTESTVNGLYTVQDTWQVETWFDPRVTSECIVRLDVNGANYEIVNTPENINLRNQYCKFKIKRVGGTA